LAPGSAGSKAVAQSTSILLGVPDGREFLVRLPIQARPCQIHAYQTGSFGGYGLLRERALGDGVYAIRTSWKAAPTMTLGDIALIGRVLPPEDGTDLTGAEVRVPIVRIKPLS
jgi:hypothetical protein